MVRLKKEEYTFRKQVLFHPEVREETPLLGLLEGANLSHITTPV
jgi:hypothetical protein